MQKRKAKVRRLEAAVALREKGNKAVARSKEITCDAETLHEQIHLNRAEILYTESLLTLPPLLQYIGNSYLFSKIQDASAFALTNRALCFLKLADRPMVESGILQCSGLFHSGIKKLFRYARDDCNAALFLKPNYEMARHRRAMANFEIACTIAREASQKETTAYRATTLLARASADWEMLATSAEARIEALSIDVNKCRTQYQCLRECDAESSATKPSNLGMMEDRLLARAERSILKKKLKALLKARKKDTSSLKNAGKWLNTVKAWAAALGDEGQKYPGSSSSPSSSSSSSSLTPSPYKSKLPDPSLVKKMTDILRKENAPSQNCTSLVTRLNEDVQVMVCFFLSPVDLASFSTCAKYVVQITQKNVLWLSLFELRFCHDASSLCDPIIWSHRTVTAATTTGKSVSPRPLPWEKHQSAAMIDAEEAVRAALAARNTHSNAPNGTWKRIYKGFLFGLINLRLQVFNRETAHNLEFAMSCYTATVVYRRVADRFFYVRETSRFESDRINFSCVASDTSEHLLYNQNIIDRHRKYTTVGAYYVTYEQDGRGTVQETVTPGQLRMIPRDISALPSSSSLFCDDTMRAEDFEVGDGVEIQWKRQEAHPYGWWYGEVESVWQDTEEETGQVGDLLHVAIPGAISSIPVLIPETGRAVEVIPRTDGETSSVAADLVNAHLESRGRGLAWKEDESSAQPQHPQAILTKITVVFPQYVEDSPWRRVTVVLGTTHAVRSLGGYLGGIRPAAGAGASPKERATAKRIWEKNRTYLPKQRIL